MNPDEIRALTPEDLQNITQETAVKLVLGGVAGAAVVYYSLGGIFGLMRSPPPHSGPGPLRERKRVAREEQRQARTQVLLFGGSMLMLWGLTKYAQISKDLQFLVDVNAEPPETWAKFKAALDEQAQKVAAQVSP